MLTILIVIITSLISIASFQQPAIRSALDFRPYRIITKREYYRFISHIMVHSNWTHLIINMLVLFSFGRYVEHIFSELEQNGTIFSAKIVFLILYLSGSIAASLSGFFKHRKDPYSSSLGASGGISAVLFTSIFFFPLEKIYFYGLIPVPGILFGVFYLIYSSYMEKRGKDNIDHEAHFWGAVFGFIFPLLIQPSLINHFLNHFL